MRCAIYQNAPHINSELRNKQINEILVKADRAHVDFVCFPEGFLTGYYDDKELTLKNSFNVSDKAFRQFVRNTQKFRATIIIGFNEVDNEGNLYDSAALIERGHLLGIQRKHYQYHQFCSKGNQFTPFLSKGILFGVIMCLDSNYFEPSRLLAAQGATILFVPSCNKVSFDHILSKRPPYYSHFSARAHENRCWLLSSDWIYKDENNNVICPGHSAIYDANGIEISRSKEMKEDFLFIDIPSCFFKEAKGKRVFGSTRLWDELKKLY